MPHKNHGHAYRSKDERERPAGRGDWKGRIGNGHGYRTPGRDGRDVEGAGGSVCVVDAGIGGREENKDSRSDKDGKGGSEALGKPLKFRRGT